MTLPISVYTGERIKEIKHTPLLNHVFGNGDSAYQTPFYTLLPEGLPALLKVVDRVSDADAIMIPHNYFSLRKHAPYVEAFRRIAHQNNKPLIVIAHGDSSDDIPIPEGVIFRTSRYRHQKKANEIMMPAFVEDLGKKRSVPLRKKNDILTVGFCGWAAARDFQSKLKFQLKRILFRGEKSLGVSIRKDALSVLRRARHVRLNTVVRKTYSGHRNTISVPPRQARKEYIENIIQSDVTLSPKGDGNYSARFYEVLSLSRIPLLIDTDMELPLESIVSYEDAIVRIPYTSLGTLDAIIDDWFENVTDERFINMQRNARKLFDMYLRTDKFFEYIFKHADIYIVRH